MDEFSTSHHIDVLIDFVESHDNLRYKLLPNPHFISHGIYQKYSPLLRVYEPIASLLLIEYFPSENATDSSVVLSNGSKYSVNKPVLLSWLEQKRRIYAIEEFLTELQDE